MNDCYNGRGRVRRFRVGALEDGFVCSRFAGYLRESVGNYFWRANTGKELDLVEERGGRLYGYEMKWGKASPRPPKDWTSAYPDSGWQVINRENYLEFIAG